MQAAIVPKPDNAEAAAETAAEPIFETPLAEQMPDVANWMPEALVPYWETLNAYPAIGGVIVAALFYIFALTFRGVMSSSLGRLAGRSKTDIDDRIIALLRKPIFATIFYFGLAIAIQVAQLPAGTGVMVNLALSMIVVSWIRALFPLSNVLLAALSGDNSRFDIIEPRTVPLFDLVSKLLVLLVGSYCLLMIWGINPVGWLASAGIVGIAVGFAAKDTLANLFSGFFILADSPYKLGDYVNLDNGARGKVTAIGMRSTRILTRDDIEVTVPNNLIANSIIINESGGPYEKMRLRLGVGAAYGSDVHHVCKVLEDTALSHNDVCKYPEPRVRMREFGASSLDFELLCWVERPELRGKILHQLRLAIYDNFAAENIEIPFSKQDVYIKEMPGQD
ncbi:MAG: mechanosensitive ion channel family protein [Pseudomonadales bacterium]